MNIKIKGRKIDCQWFQIGVAGDEAVETVTFEIPRYTGNNTDLSQGIAYIVFKLSDNTVGAVTVTEEEGRKRFDDDTLYLDWLVGREVTAQPGKISISIKISGLESSMWNSEISMCTVAKTIEADSPQAISFFGLEDEEPTARIADPNIEPPITISERTITIPPVLQNIAVQNDQYSETVKIICPRYFDGNDLSSYEFILRTQNSQAMYDPYLLDKAIYQTEVHLTWVLKPPQTSYSGGLQIQLWVTGNNFDWQTAPTSVNIINQLAGDPVIPLNIGIFDKLIKDLIQGGRKTAVIVGSSTGTTYTAANCDYMCNGENDQLVIEQALDSISTNGGEILLLEGKYFISDEFTINAGTAHFVTLKGQGACTQLCMNGESACISIRNSYVTLENLRITITASNWAKYELINVDADYATLRGIEISTSGGSEGRTAIQFRSGEKSCVEGCNIHNYYGYGIYTRLGTNYIQIKNNVIETPSGTRWYGIYLGGNTAQVSNNLIIGGNDYAVSLYGCAGCMITSNTMFSQKFPVYVEGAADRNVVYGNQFFYRKSANDYESNHSTSENIIGVNYIYKSGNSDWDAIGNYKSYGALSTSAPIEVGTASHKGYIQSEKTDPYTFKIVSASSPMELESNAGNGTINFKGIVTNIVKSGTEALEVGTSALTTGALYIQYDSGSGTTDVLNNLELDTLKVNDTLTVNGISSFNNKVVINPQITNGKYLGRSCFLSLETRKVLSDNSELGGAGYLFSSINSDNKTELCQMADHIKMGYANNGLTVTGINNLDFDFTTSSTTKMCPYGKMSIIIGSTSKVAQEIDTTGVVNFPNFTTNSVKSGKSELQVGTSTLENGMVYVQYDAGSGSSDSFGNTTVESLSVARDTNVKSLTATSVNIVADASRTTANGGLSVAGSANIDGSLILGKSGTGNLKLGGYTLSADTISLNTEIPTGLVLKWIFKKEDGTTNKEMLMGPVGLTIHGRLWGETLEVSSTSKFTGALTASGGASILGGLSTNTLSVSSTSTFTGKLTANGGLEVKNGLTTNSLTVTDSMSFSSISATGAVSAGTLSVSGAFSASSSAISITKPVTISAPNNSSAEFVYIKGNVRIRNYQASNNDNTGGRIRFGDGDYIQIYESSDDHLTLRGSHVHLNIGGTNVMDIESDHIQAYKPIYGVAQVGTSDLTDGSSSLATGKIYAVY